MLYNNNKIIYNKYFNWNINLKKIIKMKIFINHDINKYFYKYKKYKNIFFINLIIFTKFLYEICNLIFYASNLNKKFIIINNIFLKKNNKFLLNLIKWIIIKSKCFYIKKYNNKYKLPDILIILNNIINNNFIKKCIFNKIIIINLIKIINNYNFIDILILINKKNIKYSILYILYKFKYSII
uniref:Ribosomal protein S2 n=1 Tax=Balanophora reflexa TaxID=533299 RepID=A0A3S5XHK6_9MAGN